MKIKQRRPQSRSKKVDQYPYLNAQSLSSILLSCVYLKIPLSGVIMDALPSWIMCFLGGILEWFMRRERRELMVVGG